MRRILLAAPILFLLGFSAWAQQAAPPKPSSGPSDFKISGAVDHASRLDGGGPQGHAA